jgi:hypothetical protein
LQKASLQSHEGAKHLQQNEHGNINIIEVKIGETSLSIIFLAKTMDYTLYVVFHSSCTEFGCKVQTFVTSTHPSCQQPSFMPLGL